MIIYLDESKRLGKGEIVIGGFLSLHNTHYIDNFIKNKKKEYLIIDKVELKSTNKFGKLFLQKLSSDKDFCKLEITSFAYHFKNYYSDSTENYIDFLLEIFNNIIKNNCLKNSGKLTIIHDNLNAKNNTYVSRKIESFLKKKGLKSEFKVYNSKKYLSLQLADLIVGEYKKLYFFEDVNSLDNFLLNKDLHNKKT